MSIFPTTDAARRRRPSVPDHDLRLETDGVLVRPISGQIYLLEEADLEAWSERQAQSPRSGLVSRH